MSHAHKERKYFLAWEINVGDVHNPLDKADF